MRESNGVLLLVTAKARMAPRKRVASVREAAFMFSFLCFVCLVLQFVFELD